MNVLYLTDRLSHRGGAPHHLLDVMGSMATKHNVRVAAASMDRDVGLPPEVTFQKVSALRSSGLKTGGLDRLTPLLDWADLIHIQNVMNPAALGQATARPSIVTIQDHRVFCPGPGKTLPSGEGCNHAMSDTQCSSCLPEESHRSHMLNQTKSRLEAIRNARRVVVLSHYMSDSLQQVGLERITVIPPPVPANQLKTTTGRGFLIAGRIVRHKAPEMAYTAWKMSGTQHPLRIAGLGREKVNFPDAEDLGWLSRNDLLTAMADARAVLFPARWQEPFGITGAEALSVGTPVIAKPTGGMRDWCSEGCILIDSLEQMIDAIRHLDQNPEQATTLGRSGFQSVRRSLAPEALCEQLNHLYESTVHD